MLNQWTEPLALDTMQALIDEFAASYDFRSATPDELVAEDYRRRPLRPEDWSFLRLGPVELATCNRLLGLATNRLLCCIYDQARWLPPGIPEQPRDERARAFHGPELAALGARLRSPVEQLVFADALARTSQPLALTRERLESAWDDCNARERALRAVLSQGAASVQRDLRRMVWLQLMFVSSQRELAGRLYDVHTAEALGQLPELRRRSSSYARLRGECARLGLQTDLHAHWQFYLPTTLMLGNHAFFCVRPERMFEWLGAELFHGLHESAFLVVHDGEQAQLGSFVRVMEAQLELLSARFGARVVEHVARGFSRAELLQARADRDREEQLIWLRDVEHYCDLARTIDAKIRNEQIEIDRETFVEPREMCSTTHVHDDHRLVSIESGNMVFWAMPGMTLRLAPGEMTLVPCGRLHGSTIESDNCVYHQPIIPEAWIAGSLYRTPGGHASA
jgi:hypothetical protein